MIPEGGRIEALLIDLNSLGEIPFPKWRALEEFYHVLYIERYTDARSILLWTSEKEETITISYEVRPREAACQILEGAETLLGVSIYHTALLSAKRSFYEEFLSYPCMIASYEKGTTLDQAHSNPDFILSTIDGLYDAFKDRRLFLLGDTIIRGLRGWHIPCQSSIDSYGYRPDLVFCGRYFGQEHFLWRMDAYSEGLRRIAAGEGVEEPYREVLRVVIERIHRVNPLDGFLFIPPKPGEKSKFRGVGREIEEKTGVSDLSTSTRCIKAYPSLWSLTKKEREEAVMNAFSVTDAVKNKRILIIDDVVSTGATMEECFQLLLQSEVKDITLLALGIAQSPRKNLWKSL